MLLIDFYLGQLAALKDELKVAQGVAAGSSRTEAAPIQCLRGKIGNLEAAMGLANDHSTYIKFHVCIYCY